HQQINELLFKKLNDFNEQYELLSNRIRDNVDGNNETLTSYIGIYNHLGDELKILFPDINNQQLVNDLTTSLTSLFIHQISCLFYTLNQMSSSLFLPIVKYYHVKCATAGLNLKTSFNVNTFQIDEYDRFKIFVDKYEHVKQQLIEHQQTIKNLLKHLNEEDTRHMPSIEQI
ncbi:unnamed protein product, partial [Didymodactylos carnosus]